MWCSTCQQEVPGVRNSASGELACVRCGRAADEPSHSTAGAAPQTAEERERLLRNLEHWSDHPLLAELDDWELGEQLRHVQRLLAMHPPAHVPGQVALSDTAHSQPAPPHTSQRRRRARGSTLQRAARILAWCAMALGLAAVVCGAVLMAVAQLRGRNDLWGVGIPLFVVGQLGLVIGLVADADLARRKTRRRAASVHAPFDRMTGSIGSHQAFAATTGGLGSRQALDTVTGRMGSRPFRTGG